mmetsp:Transcript_23938/g.54454  ORF Transcript_23938/g.54454 Transcript_23938/m.54454 type:complete len:90 (-) Transcript_23938:41-310(-)
MRDHVVWCATWPCEKRERAWARGERRRVPWKPPVGRRISAAQHSQLSPQRAELTTEAAARHGDETFMLERHPDDRAVLRQGEKSRLGDG